jgi:biopolymer transport protein TolQ
MNMGEDFSSGGVAFALNHATLEGKITISVLLVFSLVSWTVIVNKFRQIRKAKSRTRQFLAAYSDSLSPLEVFERGPQKALIGAPAYDVYMTGSEELTRQVEKYGGKIPNHGMSAVRIAMERALGEASVSLESGMIVLATAISGGPFIGLLGTVWGVMDTFSGIGRAQEATLAAMAPGVASALIATVAGLVVAIPSLFCYNFLLTRTRTISMELDNFSAHLETVFATDYLRSKDAESLDDDDYLVSSLLGSGRGDSEPPVGGGAAH